MYDELVKRLREYAKEHCPLDRKSGICGCIDAREAADAIEELDREYESVAKSLDEAVERVRKLRKPRWIPVTERLPENGDWVLGIGPKKGYHVCEYIGITHFPYSGDIPWFSAKGRSLNITHWMPLPEPPKEEA